MRSGPDRVRAVMMPSQYTAAISLEDAAGHGRHRRRALRRDLDRADVRAFLDALATEFEGLPRDATEENIQARIRGTLLMALSNKFGSIVLTTGNKSEMAVGYATLYGDMAGGFAVLKDISKTLVYRLCALSQQPGPGDSRTYHHPPAVGGVARRTRPTRMRCRPTMCSTPSSRPTSSMTGAPAEIVAMGYAPADVRKVVRLIKISEYKRRQAAVGIRITPRGFGKDWRYPITSAWTDWEDVARTQRGSGPLGVPPAIV